LVPENLLMALAAVILASDLVLKVPFTDEDKKNYEALTDAYLKELVPIAKDTKARKYIIQLCI